MGLHLIHLILQLPNTTIQLPTTIQGLVKAGVTL